MQPLHPHPLPRGREITESGAAAAIRACPAIPRSPACKPRRLRAGSPALISRPQTLPHVRLQRNYFRPCMEPGFNNSRLPLPRAIPGKPGSRGYNLWGKGLHPSNSTPPMPTLFAALYFSNPAGAQDVGYFSTGHATMSTLRHEHPATLRVPHMGRCLRMS